LYALVYVVLIVAEPPQLVERAHESFRLVGTFGQAFDINFDIDKLIVKCLVSRCHLLQLSCVHIWKNCYKRTQFVMGVPA